MRLAKVAAIAGVALGSSIASFAQDMAPTTVPALPLPLHPSLILQSSALDAPLLNDTDLCPGLPEEHPLRVRLIEAEHPEPPEAEPDTQGAENDASESAAADDEEADSSEETDEGVATPNESLPKLAPLEFAIVNARKAAEHEAQWPARKNLRDALIEPKDPLLEGCARLELARLELRMRLFPEASASALKSREIVQELDARHQEAAQFVRAEALYRSGDPLRAAPLYLTLAQSPDKIRNHAARLRLSDIRFDRNRLKSAYQDYQALLTDPDGFGVGPWEERLTESAIAAREFLVAEKRLRNVIAADPGNAALESIRLADVLAVSDQLGEAREILISVSAKKTAGDAATLARMRLFELGVEQTEEEGPIAVLRREIEATNVFGLKSYGRSLLASRLLESGEWVEALGLLIPMIHDARISKLHPAVRRSLDAALMLASDSSSGMLDCGRFIEHLGDREGLALRRSGDPGPFLELGQCYESFGLHHAALDLYRDLARHFGSNIAEEVSLPIARTSIETGNVAEATAAGQLRLTLGSRDVAWRKLLGDALLASNEPQAAFDVLVALAEETPSPEILLQLVRAADDAELDVSDQARFDSVMATAGPSPDSTLGLAKLLAARIHREAGDETAAESRYVEAAHSLRRGALDAEAHYWVGRLGSEGMNGNAGLVTTPFGRLAREQSYLDALRRRSGIAPPAKAR